MIKIELNTIRKAQKTLNKVLRPTKLIFSDYLSEMTNGSVFLKPENLQITGSYKIRGAYVKIARLSSNEKKKGLVASSAGNHAQGVAYAAKETGVPSTIVMPTTTPLIKVDSTKKLGAKVVLFGDCYDDAYKKAREIEEKEGLVFIHPFDDLDIIAGQGTIGLEILEELPNVDYVLIPIGGGGLASGVATAIKLSGSNAKIIGIEPCGANAMEKSLKSKKLCKLNRVDTIADGVAVKKPGDLTYEIVSKMVDQVITVSDTEIMEAFLVLLEKQKLIAEPAGSISVASLFGKLQSLKNKNVVCLITGGNIDVLTISALVSRGLKKLGRVFEFYIDLTDKPGELLKIAEILAKLKANVIKINHDQFNSIERINNVRITFTVETNGHDHIKIIRKFLRAKGYIVKSKN